jgi:hypothetical protein
MIQNQIPSDIESLHVLHEIYEWIPNENMIRPNSIELAKKQLLMNTIENEWNTLQDYILFKVFNQDFEENSIGKKAIPYIKTSIEEYIFTESLFRYNLPSYANHYVLWFSKIKYENGKHIISEKEINEIIISELCKYIENFNFAWYINPKPSVPDFFHVQVFWIPI